MSDPQISCPEFSRLRTFLWPIHRHEHRKLIPMLLIFFLITFNYNILRIMKDAVVVTAKSSGAEVIPFIKVWAMFPGSILMTYLFARLSNRLSRETVFYIMVGGFLAFFFTFGFILYPARDSLHLHAFADYLQTILPEGCKGFVAMLRYWSFTSFYVMSELWGAIVLFVLCWGFANQTTHIQEAKRFYGIFGIGGNFSGVVAGLVSIFLCSQEYNPFLPFGNDAWEQSMTILLSLVVGSGLLTLWLFKWMNKKVVIPPQESYVQEVQKVELVKERMSLRASFAYLLQSPYVLCIAIIVVSYNVVMNLTEVVWKHQVCQLYSNPQNYNLYTNEVSTIIGVIATLASLLVSGNSIRKFGWGFTAMLTPLILLITSLAFFGTFLFQDHLSGITIATLGMSPLALVVFFGSAQNVMSRAAKYTVFDATKEMAFVPLSSDDKLKGKAVIDGICSRMGKSGGAFIHQSLLMIFVTLNASAPYVALCLFGMIGIWMLAIQLVGRKFHTLTHVAPAPRQGDLVSGDAAQVAALS